jgi:DNA-binding NtrC family response regulator
MTASTGEEAVRIANAHPFDLLFIDMKLPGIDGLDTYLSIKAVQPEATAIVMTGHSIDMANRIERLMLYSGYSCIQKPLDMAQLFGLVDEILSNRQTVLESGGIDI